MFRYLSAGHIHWVYFRAALTSFNSNASIGVKLVGIDVYSIIDATVWSLIPRRSDAEMVERYSQSIDILIIEPFYIY